LLDSLLQEIVCSPNNKTMEDVKIEF